MRHGPTAIPPSPFLCLLTFLAPADLDEGLGFDLGLLQDEARVIDLPITGSWLGEDVDQVRSKIRGLAGDDLLTPERQPAVLQ